MRAMPWAGAALLALGLGGAAAAKTRPVTLAQAGGHPRRVEVNHRLANQNARINRELRAGDITRGQAAALHQQDRALRAEERAMAHGDHSHLTRADQRALNAQEGAVSREIGQ